MHNYIPDFSYPFSPEWSYHTPTPILTDNEIKHETKQDDGAERSVDKARQRRRRGEKEAAGSGEGSIWKQITVVEHHYL